LMSEPVPQWKRLHRTQCYKSNFASTILQFYKSDITILQVRYYNFTSPILRTLTILQVQFYKLCCLNHRSDACSCYFPGTDQVRHRHPQHFGEPAAVQDGR
jgi:hypothetical protein